MAETNKINRKRLRYNRDLCSGCASCTVFCSQRRTGTSSPQRAGIRLVLEDAHGENAVLFCLQCKRAACAAACPRGALHQAEGGWWEIDAALCDACGLCVRACPHGRLYIDPANGRPIKCDLCGGEPLCVTVCATGALTYEGGPERAARSAADGDENK